MTVKKYRLETVLGIRNRAREEAARQVALRLQHLQTAEDELARRQRRLQACYEQQNTAQTAMNEQLRGGIQASSIIAHQNFLNDLRKLEAELKNDVEKQISAVTKAERELEAARDKLIDAARELKSIEVHKANWQETQQKAKTRRDQKISDEIGAILHGRRESS
jgi:flagellar export protein FliJ